MSENLNDAPEWAQKMAQTLNEATETIKSLSQKPAEKKEEVPEVDINKIVDELMPGFTENGEKREKMAKVNPVINNIVNDIM
jgi:hypothetical protein